MLSTNNIPHIQLCKTNTKRVSYLDQNVYQAQTDRRQRHETKTNINEITWEIQTQDLKELPNLLLVKLTLDTMLSYCLMLKFKLVVRA